MYCERCGNKIEEGKNACSQCGLLIENQHSNQLKEKEMNNMDEIGNHLEFLGYKIEIQEPKKEGEKKIVFARHVQKNNMVIFEPMPGIVMFRINLTTQKKPSAAMDEFMNRANKTFDVIRAHYEAENQLAVIRYDATFTGNYNKVIFGQFYEMLENDQKRMSSLDGFAKIFLD